MSELKPCPFCGKMPEIQTVDEGYHQVFCRDNHTATIYIESFEEWNSRPIEDQLKAENERLRAENERLREGLKEIANSAGIDASGYTTGEGHSDCIWKARKVLKEVKGCHT